MKKTLHVGESVTSPVLRLSPRQLHNLLTQMPLKNFAIAFNQGLNLQKKTPTCLPRRQSHRRSIVVTMRHATKTPSLESSRSFDVVLLVQSLRAADILNFRTRALFKRPRRRSNNQTRSRPHAQSGNHYRGITPTCILSKVLERIVYDQITTYLRERNILSESQYGFRTGHSCADLLTVAIDGWLLAQDSTMHYRFH